jgi:membrane protein implicated in regulation of membrane protease activity
MSYAWIIWLVVAALFVAGEVVTAGFFLFWFGVGALAAAVVALVGVNSLAAQVIVFLAVSLLLLVASRRLFDRFGPRTALRSGVETMIGQLGTVVEASQGARAESAVRVYGSVWTAFPIDGEEPLQVGESVCVTRVEGNTIYVYRPGRALPGEYRES